jgi:cytochrome P450
VQFAGARVILTADSENIKAILSTQFDDYGKGEDFRNVWGAFLGNSIFVTDGAIWKHNRAMLRPQFVRERVADLEIVDRHAMELVSMLGNGGQTVEMLDYFFRWVSSVFHMEALY